MVYLLIRIEYSHIKSENTKKKTLNKDIIPEKSQKHARKQEKENFVLFLQETRDLSERSLEDIVAFVFKNFILFQKDKVTIYT